MTQDSRLKDLAAPIAELKFMGGRLKMLADPLE